MRYVSDCAPQAPLKSLCFSTGKGVNQQTSICMKKNERVVNKAVPVKVQHPDICMVPTPHFFLPTPFKKQKQKTKTKNNPGATGNQAPKICSFHLQPEIRSKAVKIHGKSM